MFQTLTNIPEALFDCQPADVLDILGKPTLFHFSGKKKPALFISAFIHGNEVTGFMVFQELIKRYGSNNWPRETYFLIGNVWAAKENLRRLDHQPDFNRVWRDGPLSENKMAMDIMDVVNPDSLFAAVDIHNTTGRNPHYIISESLELKHLNLAALFGRNCLYFSEPEYTLSETFGKHCPAVTIEAGASGSAEGVAHTLDYINSVLRLDTIPEKNVSELDLVVLHSHGTVRLMDESSVGIGDEEGDICFSDDFDLLNFREFSAGTEFGQYRGEHRLKVNNDDKADITHDVFEHRDGKIISRVGFTPVMLKTDKRALKTNCVGYVMKRMDLSFLQ